MFLHIARAEANCPAGQRVPQLLELTQTSESGESDIPLSGLWVAWHSNLSTCLPARELQRVARLIGPLSLPCCQVFPSSCERAASGVMVHSDRPSAAGPLGVVHLQRHRHPPGCLVRVAPATPARGNQCGHPRHATFAVLRLDKRATAAPCRQQNPGQLQVSPNPAYLRLPNADSEQSWDRRRCLVRPHRHTRAWMLLSSPLGSSLRAVAYFASASALMYCHCDRGILQGSLPESWSTLTRLLTLQLGSNQITGTVPEVGHILPTPAQRDCPTVSLSSPIFLLSLVNPEPPLDKSPRMEFHFDVSLSALPFHSLSCVSILSFRGFGSSSSLPLDPPSSQCPCAVLLPLHTASARLQGSPDRTLLPCCLRHSVLTSLLPGSPCTELECHD